MKNEKNIKRKRKSLFLRIFSINLAIILIAFILMSAICYSRINSYLKAEHVSSILTASSRVLDLSKRTEELYDELSYMQRENPSVHYNYSRLVGQIEHNYRNTLALIASSTDFSLMQISPEGKIIFRYADIESFNPGLILSKEDKFTGRLEEYLNAPLSFGDMLKGNFPQSVSKVSYSGEDFFVSWGDMDKMFKTSSLTVMKPLYENNEISSMLVLFIPTPQIKFLLNVVASNFILAAAISLFISVILSYALSYRISRPLKAMNSAALKLASGDFSQRVSEDDKIGEIHELIKTFNDMAESIENSEENQRVFTASIAHELRTPMTSIIGFIDSILDGTIPEEKASEYLDICLSEARRLSKLTTELIDISRFENGNMKLESEPFDINECIRRQIIKSEDLIADKNLDVSVEFETDECICLCDKDSITRVFVNLIDNSIKFANNGGYIKVSVKNYSGKAYISVENSGEGIETRDLKHIFDKFYKTDKSRSLDKKGIGLGLYLVKNILSLHGESINVESKVGEFTRFTFTLKLQKGISRK